MIVVASLPATSLHRVAFQTTVACGVQEKRDAHPTHCSCRDLSLDSAWDTTTSKIYVDNLMMQDVFIGHLSVSHLAMCFEKLIILCPINKFFS